MLGQPILWAAVLAVVCSAIALPLYLSEEGDGFWAFLLTLVAGWAAGAVFVGAVLRVGVRWLGWTLHIVGAAVGWILIAVFASSGDAMATLPTDTRAVLYFAQMAAIPAIGWVSITLIARVSGAVGSTSAARAVATKRADAATREWRREDGSWVLDVAVVPVSTRALVVVGGVIWVVAATLAGTLMAVFYDLALRVGSAVVVLVFGVAIAVPAYALFVGVFRSRTTAIRIALGSSALVIERPADDGAAGPGAVPARTSIALRELEELVWREDGLFARLEFRAGSGMSDSYIAGIAQASKGILSRLPPLPRGSTAVFQKAGLSPSPISRRARGAAFRRDPA